MTTTSFLPLTDEQIEQAEEILSANQFQGWDFNKFGYLYIGVTGKHSVFYTLWKYKPSSSPYVNPETYICNLSTDLIEAAKKAKKIAGKVPVQIDNCGTRKGFQGKPNLVLFGKYRGIEIGEVYAQDPQYVLWMRKAINTGSLKIKNANLISKIDELVELYWLTLTEKNQETSTSQYFGTIGERVELSLQVVSIFNGKIKMKDAEGNLFYTYTGIQVEKGQEIKVKATIMKHVEITGIKQTYINRVK